MDERGGGGTGSRMRSQPQTERLLPRISLADDDPVPAAIKAAIKARLAEGVATLGDVLLLLADYITAVDDEVALGVAPSRATMGLYWRVHVFAWIATERYPGRAGLETPWCDVLAAWHTSGQDAGFSVEDLAAMTQVDGSQVSFRRASHMASPDRPPGGHKAPSGAAPEAEPAPRTWRDKKARAAELKQAGLSDRAAGRRLGCDGKTARRWAEAGGFQYPHRPTPHAETA